jgi:hypothetical protein
MNLYTRVLVLVVFLSSLSAWALKVALPPGLGDASLNLDFQLQGWLQTAEAGGPDGTSWDNRVFLRRARFIGFGDFTKQIHFFFNIDAPNVGRTNAGTAPTTSVILQDAALIYEPVPGIFVTGGFLIIPLSHMIHQSTLSFATIENHTATLRFQQTGTGQYNTAFREPGVEVHGWLFDQRVGFRGGMYNGVRGTTGTYSATNLAAGLNPHSIPRFAGYVHVNFLEPEDKGMLQLYQGVYFSDKPILSVGGGISYQTKSVQNGTPATGSRIDDYRGTSADVFLEYPTLPDQAINAAFAYYNYDFGTGNQSTGNGFYGDLAYRIGQWQPIFSYEYFDGDAHTDDVRIWTAGINWWINKTATNLKLEFQDLRRGRLNEPTGTAAPSGVAAPANQKLITLAAQLFW